MNQGENELKRPKLLFYQEKGFNEKFETLTSKEKFYFQAMKSQFGVPFIKAKPGVAKSAIGRSIAKKLGLQYVDIRLSMADETDMQFPNLTFDQDLGQHVIEHAIPEWAAMSNQKPTLIHFEELNRAPLAVRNAALQILLERGIGPKFKFNENVFMMSSGNLGEEDGTDVEEFDAALNNRLIQIKHDLTVDEWMDWGADTILHPDITNFIGHYPEYFYKKPGGDEKDVQAYATPRSWHMLSEFIYKNHGGGPKIDPSTIKREMRKIDGVMMDMLVSQDVFRHPSENGQIGEPIYFYDGIKYEEGKTNLSQDSLVRNWGDDIQYVADVMRIGHGIIGAPAGTAFMRWLEERTRIQLKDIIENYAKCKKELDKFNRDKYSELITEAKNAPINKWTPKQIDNFADFLNDCSPDERTGFLLYMLDMGNSLFPNGIKSPSLVNLLKRFRSDLVRIKAFNSEGNK